jgi:beta-phosphoglucomutase
MDIKACIFDLDGVITDTAKFHYLAWSELAENLGFSFSSEQNEQLKGISRDASLEILLKIGNKSFDTETKKKLAERKNKRYIEFIQQMTPDDILPGVLDFLDELKNCKIRIALGSASKNAQLILNKIGVTSYFDTIIDGNLVANAKPHPEVFLKAAEQLHISPENCVVFEDAAAGIDAARNAQMRNIGIGSKHSLPNADFVIANFTDFSLKKLKTLMSK